MDYRFTFERHSRRVEAVLAGTVIADSTRAVVLRETRLPPVFYFPREDVRMDLLARSAHRTYCPLRGNALYWTAELPGRREENIAWSYEEPLAEAEPIRGHIAFYSARLDELRDGGAPEGPGAVDLTARLVRADGRATARYLPLASLIGAQTRRWVETSVLAGTVKEARLRPKGDLRDFPFTDAAKAWRFG